jgi:hypothetical protein
MKRSVSKGKEVASLTRRAGAGAEAAAMGWLLSRARTGPSPGSQASALGALMTRTQHEEGYEDLKTYL